MSKKNKKQSQAESGAVFSGASAHAAEYRIIKHDLIKVLLLNALYLAAVLVVYFTDQKTHYLEQWFSKLLHF